MRRQRHCQPSQRCRARGIVGAVCLSWIASSQVHAIDLSGGDLPSATIAGLERRKDYDAAKKLGAAEVSDVRFGGAEGIRLGNFYFLPSLDTQLRFDDNLYSTARDRKSDMVSQITPTLRVRSDLPRHAFNAELSGRIVSHAQHDDQDFADLSASANGALHFDHAHTLSVAVLSALQHEDTLDPSLPRNAGRPIEYVHNRASIGITRDVGRLYGTFSTTVASWDYRNSMTRDGVVIDQDQRDATMLKNQLNAGYRFSPGYELRARATTTRIWNKGNDTIDRDSLGWEGLVGLRAELNPLLRWEVLGGWGVREFDQLGLKALNTYVFETQLTWLVTQRLTLYGTFGRSIAEPADDTGNGRVDTRLKGRAELELWHNLVLKLGAEIRDSEISGVSHAARTISGNVGLDYHLSDNWLFTIAYHYQNLQLKQGDDDVMRNRISIGARLRF